MKIKLFLFGLLLVSGIGMSYAQSTTPKVIASTGGTGSNTTHQLSWTIGEPIIATVTGPSATLTQGFHQPNIVINSVFQLQEAIAIEVFPNPTSQYITITIMEETAETALTLRLIDVTGKELKKQAFSTGTLVYQWSVEHCPAGIYWLTVHNSKNEITNTFQIVKQ